MVPYGNIYAGGFENLPAWDSGPRDALGRASRWWPGNYLLGAASEMALPCIMSFYNSKKWIEKRKRVLLRDKYMDQIAIADGIRIEADTVHHILPRDKFPEYQYEDWNLISVNNLHTHKRRLHERFGGLTKFGEALMRATAAAHGIKLGMITLVVGLPGSGKSTWAKKNLGGGLCYEMDAIAAAFRLRVPHEEPEGNAAARQMAAALRRGWLAEVKNYTDNIMIVRTAPDADELAETMPDRIIVCEKVFVERPYKFDKKEYEKQLTGVIDWAVENGVNLEYYPPRA